MAHQILADIAASVVRVLVSVGDTVRPGEELVVLESMKMEMPILAATGGTVTSVPVFEGGIVQEGDVIVVIE